MSWIGLMLVWWTGLVIMQWRGLFTTWLARIKFCFSTTKAAFSSSSSL